MAIIEMSPSAIKKQKRKREKQDKYYKNKSGECVSIYRSKEEIEAMLKNIENRKKGMPEKEVKVTNFRYRSKSDIFIDKLKANGIYDEFLAYDKDYTNYATKDDFYSFPFSLLKYYNENFMKRPPSAPWEKQVFNFFIQDNVYEWFMHIYNKNKHWLDRDWKALKNK